MDEGEVCGDLVGGRRLEKKVGRSIGVRVGDAVERARGDGGGGGRRRSIQVLQQGPAKSNDRAGRIDGDARE